MSDIYLILFILFFVIFILGLLLEKIRIPGVFAALLTGVFLSIQNPFTTFTKSETFNFLATLGMYFLLFLIGLEIDLKSLMSHRKIIFRTTFIIILLDSLLGSLIIHFIFGYSWLISGLVALSFSTVGEAFIIPILDEFNLVNTPLGQTIIGIGTLDDIVELITLIATGFLIGSKSGSHISTVIASISVVFIITGIALKLGSNQKLKNLKTEFLYLVSLAVMFLFIWIGSFAEMQPLAVLLAGVSIRNLIPHERQNELLKIFKITTYAFFGPLFFLWVGISLHITYLMSAPLLILLVVLVSNSAKIAGSIIGSGKELGIKNSIFMGVSLSVRFSTSIIIIKYLYDNQVIDVNLFSIIIASSIVFKFIVPILLSRLSVSGFSSPNRSVGIKQ